MNAHVTKELIEEWRGFEFQGKPWVTVDNKWIKAWAKTTNITYYYCFEENMMYNRISYIDLKEDNL